MIQQLSSGLLNFMVYLTPLYLFMLNSLNLKYHWHNHMEKIFHPFNTYIALLFTIIFLWSQNIWKIQNHTLLILGIYSIAFWTIYSFSKDKGYFSAFTIATLSIFAISEIWEISIKINNLLILDGETQLKILFMSFFKMISIPILIYYSKKWRWQIKDKELRGLYKAFIILTILLLVLQIQCLTDFLYGVMLRIVVSGTFIIYSLGFKRNIGDV